MFNLLYLKKTKKHKTIFDCCETKNNKFIYWTLGLKFNLTINFDLVHDLNLKFSRSNIRFAVSQEKNGFIIMKQTYQLNTRAQNVAIKFDHGHDLDI